MVRSVIFHLGDCKTGSTSIQQVLRNHAWSGGCRVCYPRAGAPGRERPVLHHARLAKVFCGAGRAGEANDLYDSLARQLSESDADIGIVSAEHFEFADPILLRKAITRHLGRLGADIRLIAYVRPHAARLVSSFAEQVKIGNRTPDLEDFVTRQIRRKRFFYHDRFMRWRKTFGTAFTLRPLLRERLHEGNVVADFLRLAFGDTPFTITSQADANPSLSLEQLLAVREIYRHSTTAGRNAPLGRNLARYIGRLAPGGGTRIRMHRKLAERVIDTYLPDARKMDRTFFADGAFGPEPMTRALLAARDQCVETPQSMRLDDHFRPETTRMIRILARLIARMEPVGDGRWSGHFSTLRMLEEGLLSPRTPGG